MSNHPNKEELSVNVQDRLNKEEAYALYGAYAPSEVVDRMKGKAPKMQQPYPLTEFPSVPDYMQDHFALASLKASPEKNLRSFELVRDYRAQPYARDDYTPINLEARNAGITTANLIGLDLSTRNRISNNRLSRNAAASVVEFNLQNDPKEYAKYIEARTHIGKAADYYGSNAAVVQQASYNYLYSKYGAELSDEKYGHVSLAYLASDVGQAATPDDLKILRRVAASQDESIRGVVYDSNFLTEVYNMKKDLIGRLENIDKDKRHSQDIEELYQLYKIYEQFISEKGFVGGALAGAYEWAMFLPQDFVDILKQENYGYVSNTQQFLLDRLYDDTVPDYLKNTTYLTQGLGGTKFFETLNMEANRRENMGAYLAIAAKTGKSFNEVVAENKDNFDKQLAGRAAMSMANVMLGPTSGTGKIIASPFIEKLAASKAAKALMYTGAEVGGDAVLAGVATAPMQGAISAAQYELAAENKLPTEYNSVKQAFAWGMLNNLIDNMASGVTLSSPWIFHDIYRWAKDHEDVAAANRTSEEAGMVQQISTMQDAPEATKQAVANTLKQQGYQEKVVYFYPEDLREIAEDPELDLSWMTDEQREFLFGDIAKRIENGQMVILSREDLGQYFKGTNIEERLANIWRDRATAASKDEQELMDSTRADYINELAEENPELATNTKEEREAARLSAVHELEEQITSMTYSRIDMAGAANISKPNINLVSREVAGLAITLVDEYNLPIESAKEFLLKTLPTFGKRKTTLDIESGRAKDKTRGTYDPDANVIELSDDADISTLIHELSHYYLDTIMKLADEYKDNDRLQRMKELVYGGYINEDPELLKKSWAELDPELKERIQETFAYEYLEMRVNRTLSPDDYEAINKLDEKGNKTGRRYSAITVRLDRALAYAKAKFFGRDLRGKTDAEKRAEVQATNLAARAAFERDYGIKEIPSNMKLFAAMVDSATTGFVDMHRITNLYPIGDTVLNIPNLSKEDAQKLKHAFDTIYDELHAQIYMTVAKAGREEIRNIDKAYKMRKKDIEKKPEYKLMRKELKRYEDEFKQRTAEANEISGAVEQLDNQLEGLKIKRETINTPEYRKERGTIKRRVTHLSQTIEDNNQKILNLSEQAAANEIEFVATRTQNNINRETYEAAQAATAAKKEDLDKAIRIHNKLKELRAEYAKKIDEIDPDELAGARIATKNQGDVVRRASKRLAELEKREREAFDAFNATALKEAQLRETHNRLAAEIDELATTQVTLGDELADKQSTLSVDPVADINAEIDDIKLQIKANRDSLKEAQSAARAAEKNLNRVKRQYKDVEANYYNDLKNLDERFGNAEQRLQACREQAAYDLDNGNGAISQIYQDAVFWKEQLDALGDDGTNPLWNDAIDHFGVGSKEELLEYLERNTNRKDLIDELATQYYSYNESLELTQERLGMMSLKTASKILRTELGFIEGQLNKVSRDARKFIRYKAKQYRAYAAQMRFANTSPAQMMHRAYSARIRAQKILTQPSKYETPTDMLMAAYEQMALADFYVEAAQAGTRMKNQIQKELQQVVNKLNAKGVYDKISGEHVEAAKAILSRVGVIRGNRSNIILEQIKRDFPEQWDRVKDFLGQREDLAMQHYTQMQLGDLFGVVDLVQVIIHNGEQALADRKAGERMKMGAEAQAIMDNISGAVANNPKKKSELEDTSVTVVNKPDNSQLSGWRRMLARVRSSLNRTYTMQAVVEMVDGKDGGDFKKVFFDPVADANNKFINDDRELGTKLQPMFEKARELFDPRVKGLPEHIDIPTREGNGTVRIKQGADGNIRKALVGILVHIGNDSNLEALCRSLNVEPDVMVQTIRQLERDGVITAELMDHVQAFWDAYKDVGLKAQKAYNEINNRFYKPVEARSITMCGKTYAGGYAPLTRQRDALNSDASLAEQLNDAAHDLPPAYDPSFAQERSTSSTLPLDLSYDGIMNGLSRQLRYADLMPALYRLNNFTNHAPEVMRGLEIVIPGFKDEIFMPWMRAVANQSSDDIKVNDGMRALGNAGARINQSIMAGNISNAAQQLTGFLVATAKVSPSALLSTIFSPISREDIFKVSPYMRARLEDNKKNMSILRRDLRSYKKWERGKNFLDDHAYFLQTITQNWIDRRIWSAKYKEELRKTGDTDAAVKAADQAVRLTQGSFNIVDSSSFDRDPVSKLLVPFMNYFQAMANLWRARAAQANRGINSRVHRAFNDIMLALQIMIIPSLAAYAIAQSIKGYWTEADEEDGWQFMEDASASAATGVLSSIHPFLGQTAGIAYNIVQDKPTPTSLINAPLATLVPSAMRSAGHIYDFVVNDEDLNSYDVINVLRVANAAGFWPALGTAAATRGFVAVTMGAGDVEGDSGLDDARAIVTGTLSDAQKGNR